MKVSLYWVLLSILFVLQTQAMLSFCDCSKKFESCIKTKHKDLSKLKKYVTDDDTIDMELQALDKRINALKFHIQANIIQFLDVSVDVESLSIFTQIYAEYMQFQRRNKYPIKSLSNTRENWYNSKTVSMINSVPSIWNDFELRTGIKLNSAEWKHFSTILKMTNMVLFTKKRYWKRHRYGDRFDDGLFEIRRNMFLFTYYSRQLTYHHWKIEVPTRVDFTNYDNKKETIIPSFENIKIYDDPMGTNNTFGYFYHLMLKLTIGQTKNWLLLSSDPQKNHYLNPENNIIRPDHNCAIFYSGWSYSEYILNFSGESDNKQTYCFERNSKKISMVVEFTTMINKKKE